MGNGRNVQQTVGAAGNCRVNQNGIFKAVHGHDLGGTHIRIASHGNGPLSRLSCVGKKVRAGSRHQGAAWERQPKSLCHDLHGGSGSDKGAGSAAWTGVAFRPV